MVTLLVEPEMLMTSALKRLPAISKEVLVRVLGSKKRLTIVRPLRVGTFLIGRVEISLKDSVASRMVMMSSFDSWLIPSKSL